jgi:GNAT superfamily N-acetyltransferase
MKIRSSNLDELLVVHNQIAELTPIASSDYFAARIGAQPYLALVADCDGAIAGYKLGYWLAPTIFYSWLGGVHPDYRKQGIAKQLMVEQERRVVELGAQEIRVKSMNRYKAMLLLLIAQGYDITGTEADTARDIKIHFTKFFNKPDGLSHPN